MTTTSPINSGAINALSFPGSQEGEALVELIGSVVVACAISSLLIYSHNTASVSASASGSASITLKRGITCSTSPVANTSASAVKLVKTGLASTSPRAQCSLGVALARTIGSSVNASAYGVSSIRINTRRSATAVASALSAPTGSLRLIHTSAQSSASASSVAEARKKVFISGSASPLAQTIALETYGRAVGGTAVASAYGTVTEAITKVHWVEATVDAQASGTASTRRHATVGASISPSADASVYARRDLLTPAIVTAASAKVSARELIHVRRSAGITPSASTSTGVGVRISESSLINCTATSLIAEDVLHYSIPVAISPMAITSVGGWRITNGANSVEVSSDGSAVIKLSASCTAGVSSSSAALDFSVGSSAPVERQMFVEASERRMEVTL